MNYRRIFAFLFCCFVIFNSAYVLFSWNYNQPQLDDFYQLRLFVNAGTPPPEWYMTVELYDGDMLLEQRTSTWYNSSSCHVVYFALSFSATNEEWSIQNKTFVVSDSINPDNPNVNYNFTLNSDWERGTSASWPMWYQDVEGVSIVAGLGPYYDAPPLTYSQQWTLFDINAYCILMIGIFVCGYEYRRAEEAE